MAREYIVGGTNITVAGATTLVFINPPAAPNPGIEIIRCWINQAANATSVQQRVQLVTQVTAFPTLTSTTPVKLNNTDATAVITGGTAGAAGTSGINASAEGAGAKTVKIPDAFNVLNGWYWEPPQGSRGLYLPAGSTSGFGMFFPTAPATLTGWEFGVIYREG